MQKILVTGANSFVGKHLVPFLNSKDYEVQGTARREESLRVPANRKLTSYRPNLIGDLSDENFLKNVKWKPDIIVHLAANSNLSSNLSKMVRDNISAVLNLTTFAEQVNCSKIIALSTISVHGQIHNQKISENTGFVNPDTYGLTKRVGEIIFQQNESISSSYILRLPAILGVGASKHWISKVLTNAIEGKDINIYNPTNMFNNAIYLMDLLHFIEKLFGRLDLGVFTFPLASTEPILISRVVELIVEQCNSKSNIIQSKQNRGSFTIDDSFARNFFSFNSLNISSAIRNYIKDTRLCTDYYGD
jgi:nucleoside-diphosphate-sugar epimerase